MNEEEIEESLCIEEESLCIENIGKLPFSVIVLILMAFVFAFSSVDMTPKEAISALVFMLIIFIPLFLIDIRREERKV
jgi:hydrogenase-4 membrane subunit HyfE